MNNLKKFLLPLSMLGFAVASYAQTPAPLTVANGETKSISGEIYVEPNGYGYSEITVNSGGTLNVEDGSVFYMYAGGTDPNKVKIVDVAGTLNFNATDVYSKFYLSSGQMYISGSLNSNVDVYLGGGTDAAAYIKVDGKNAKASFGNINVMGGKTNIRVDNGGTLTCNEISLHKNIDESAVLSMNGGSTINAKTIIASANAVINFGAGVVNVDNIGLSSQSKEEKAKLNVNQGAVLNINEGYSSVLAGTTINEGATLNIKSGKVQTYGDSAFLMNGGVLNIADGASMIVADAKLVDENNQYTFLVGKGRKNQINLKGSGYLHTASSQGGNDFKVGAYSGKVDVTITAGRQGAIVADKVTFVNNGSGADGTIILNSKNIFVGSKGYDTVTGEYKEGYASDFANFNTVVVLGSNVSAEIVVNADSAFGAISWQQNCELAITLGDSGVISFTQFEKGYAFEKNGENGARLTINEFENNRIFIQNMSEVGAMVGTKLPGYTVSISATLSEGYIQYEQNQNRTYTNADFQMVAGEWNGVQGYWLNMPALVPEPAEWAMIFGAIALGLAMYRRRK